MGLQSAASLHARGPPTTCMTGMLATFGTGLVRWLGRGRRPTGDGTHAMDDTRAHERLPWRSGVGWLIYLAGAILCGVLFLRFGAIALLMPIAISIVSVGVRGRPPH